MHNFASQKLIHLDDIQPSISQASLPRMKIDAISKVALEKFIRAMRLVYDHSPESANVINHTVLATAGICASF